MALAGAPLLLAYDKHGKFRIVLSLSKAGR